MKIWKNSKLMLKKMSLQLYKKMQKETAQTQCLSRFILAGVEGLEPSRTVLETGMLPLHHTPKERHIKLFLCYNTVIGTRLWRLSLYQLNYTPKYSLTQRMKVYHIFYGMSIPKKYFFTRRRSYER